MELSERAITNLTRLAEMLEAEPKGFDMLEYIKPCGSPGCMAGHVVADFAPHVFKEICSHKGGIKLSETIKMLAETHLDIGEDLASRLFTPTGEGKGGLAPYAASAKGAAQVVRNLIATGEVNWEVCTEFRDG